MIFNRTAFIERIDKKSDWDVIIIGGGATGLGTAVDAASRGYSTLLLEQSDFAKGTSSRSTKLVHGGVRYLAQGDIALVYEALHERGLLLKNAAHLVKDQDFIIPCYSWFSKYKYLIGLKFYDLLAGKSGFKNRLFYLLIRFYKQFQV
ncbi:FAD-dependent oxidoreductase [Pedobacter steynii]